MVCPNCGGSIIETCQMFGVMRQKIEYMEQVDGDTLISYADEQPDIEIREKESGEYRCNSCGDWFSLFPSFAEELDGNAPAFWVTTCHEPVYACKDAQHTWRLTDVLANGQPKEVS